jgi:hypothetical protein
MNRLQSSGILISLVILISGCNKDAEKSEFELIEYLEVSGACKENHSNKPGKYYGSLVHWYNKKKGTHDRYGSVTTLGPNSDLVGEVLEEIKDPNKYFPPFSVDFESIPAIFFNAPIMQLEGISSDISNDESGINNRFQASCVLKVIKRLDYIPETNEVSQGKDK